MRRADVEVASRARMVWWQPQCHRQTGGERGWGQVGEWVMGGGLV